MTSSLNEWNINPTPDVLEYHLKQWDKPLRQTVAFAKFIESFVKDNTNIADLGCGAGASTAYINKVFPKANVAGFDISSRLIAEANKRRPDWYIELDICNLPADGIVDGVISLQTFSWMPDIETPLEQICTKIKPRWMAFSSLFHPGDISCKIEVDEPKRPRKSFYNIYSIPRTGAFLERHGYRLAKAEAFKIDIDLPFPKSLDIMQSYTWYGKIFSGPLYLPWWFLAFERV